VEYEKGDRLLYGIQSVSFSLPARVLIAKLNLSDSLQHALQGDGDRALFC